MTDRGAIDQLRTEVRNISTTQLRADVATAQADITAIEALAASHDHVGGDGAQIDHGGLAGLADDDHTQYHTAARHSAFHSLIRGTRITSNQSIAHNTATVVILNELTEEVDPADDFDLNTSTGVFTINTTGIYQISCGAIYANGATNFTRQLIRIFVSGNPIAGLDTGRSTAGTGAAQMWLSHVSSLTAADEVTLVVLHGVVTPASVDLLANAQTTMTIARLA